MKKPKLSPDFTVDDIHKLREYNSERRKNMTSEELKKDIKKTSDKFEKELINLRNMRKTMER